MAVGQAVPTSTLDVGALDAVETRLELRGVAVCHVHAGLLRDVLDLHRVLSAAGAGLSTVPQAALLLQVSEHAAQALLAEAQLLASGPARPDGPGRAVRSTTHAIRPSARDPSREERTT